MFTRTTILAGMLLCCGASLTSLNLQPGVEGAFADVPEVAASDTAIVKLAITGMTCGSCATTARIALERVYGVYDAEVSYDSASAVVVYDPERTSPEEFIAQLKEMTGYEARVVEPAQKPKETP